MKRKQETKAPTVVFKKGSKTAKTDTHLKHRNSVFGTTKPVNPIKTVLFEESIKGIRLTSANRRK